MNHSSWRYENKKPSYLRTSKNLFDVISFDIYDKKIITKFIKKYKNKKNDSNETALMVSIQNKRSDIANELIDNNCELNCLDNSKNTALMHAIIHGQQAIAIRLINLNCDINVRNMYYETALSYAVSDFINKNIAFALIDKNNLEFKQPAKMNFFRKKIIKIQLVDMQDINGFPALMRVITLLFDYKRLYADNKQYDPTNYNEIAKKLITSTCNLNIKNKANNNALEHAIKYELYEIIDLIIDKYILNDDIASIDIENQLNRNKPIYHYINQKIVKVYENKILQIIKANDNIMAKCFNNLGDLNVVNLICLYCT